MIPAIIVLIIIVDGLVVGGAFWSLVNLKWNRLAAQFPERPPAPDAVSRRAQSFSIGMFNLGWSVHVAVDNECLHLTPAAYLRWFGAKRISVPWDAIRIVKRSTWMRMISVRIGNHSMTGPAWCLGLAEPAGGEDSSPLP